MSLVKLLPGGDPFAPVLQYGSYGMDCYTVVMEPTHSVSLTPEQIAAIHAGGGFALCEDPSTHVQYQLIQVEPAAIDDDYIRAKLQEAYDDPTEVQPLDMAKIKAELARRLAAIKNQKVG